MRAKYNRSGSNQPQQLETQNWCECFVQPLLSGSNHYNLLSVYLTFLYLVQTPKNCICIYYVLMYACKHIHKNVYKTNDESNKHNIEQQKSDPR